MTALGHQHDDFVFAQLSAEKPRIAGLRILTGSHEPAWVELIVSPEKECAEPAEGGQIRSGRRPNRDGIRHELRLHATTPD